MINDTWVLMDASYLAHRAFHALRDLSHGDFPTGVLFGFFEQIRTICFDPRVLSNRTAIFFDSRQSHRKRQFSDYKKKRHEERTPDEVLKLKELWIQLRLLREGLLPEMGFPVYRQTGLESDDLIAHIAFQLSPPFSQTERKGVIITGDGDLYQCITEAIHWYDPGRDKYLDVGAFMLKTGLRPESWATVKAMAGCPGDGVPGIPGIGVKTACDFLSGLLPKTYKRYKAIESTKAGVIVSRNMDLVRLPHKKTRLFTLEEPQYHPEVFFDMCKQYGIRSCLEGPRHKEWLAFFSGQIEAGRQVPRKRGEHRE